MGCGSPCRNQSNSILAFGVGDKQQDLAARHANDDEPGLTIIFPFVQPFYCERVAEDRFGQLEAHSVSRQVNFGFGVVPFKF